MNANASHFDYYEDNAIAEKFLAGKEWKKNNYDVDWNADDGVLIN